MGLVVSGILMCGLLLFFYRVFESVPKPQVAGDNLPTPKIRDGADWPCWRSSQGNGISLDSNWDPQSLAAPRTLWKVNVGKGYSSVSVVGPYLYTVGNDDGKDTIYCLSLETGRAVWSHSYPCKAGPSYPGPRATPAVDGSLIYSLGREGHLVCLDAHKGDVKWQRHLVSELEAKVPGWGFASSPCIAGDLVVVNAGESGMAFDKESGQNAWVSRADVACGYATPVKFRQNSQELLAIFSGKALCAVDAKSGRLLWSYPWETDYDVNAADPIVVGEEIFITSGYKRGCALLDIHGKSPEVIWKNDHLSSHFGSSLYIDGHIYGPDGNTESWQPRLKCLEWRTGKVKWEKALSFGNVIAADGKLLFLQEDGNIVISHASPDSYGEIATGPMLPPRKMAKCWTMPVLCKGLLFCRNDIGDLVCIDAGK